MGRESRLGNKRIGAPEARRVTNQLQTADKLLRGAPTARELDRHHATKSVEHRLRNVVIRMRRKARVVHRANFLLADTPLGDTHRVFIVTTNANVERLEAAVEEPRRKWIG